MTIESLHGKNTFSLGEQERHKPACAVAQSDYRFHYSLSEKNDNYDFQYHS